ncbi:hypothetical protein C8P63_13513 [Melghirimyces profundicolus]|uniref:Uncharacterized protein n=1 Tax=Melghirimyces profundicolus TaxID=1242148 RepID=A0A2T6B4A6_9BACL|nr:hypothetical protein C8P63_13513 [Melghirimyces profundicolus]
MEAPSERNECSPRRSGRVTSRKRVCKSKREEASRPPRTPVFRYILLPSRLSLSAPEFHRIHRLRGSRTEEVFLSPSPPVGIFTQPRRIRWKHGFYGFFGSHSVEKRRLYSGRLFHLTTNRRTVTPFFRFNGKRVVLSPFHSVGDGCSKERPPAGTGSRWPRKTRKSEWCGPVR